MPKYRGVFLGDGPGLREFTIQAETDADAFLAAETKLQNSAFASVEVWDATRKIGAVALKTTARPDFIPPAPRSRV